MIGQKAGARLRAMRRQRRATRHFPCSSATIGQTPPEFGERSYGGITTCQRRRAQIRGQYMAAGMEVAGLAVGGDHGAAGISQRLANGCN